MNGTLNRSGLSVYGMLLRTGCDGLGPASVKSRPCAILLNGADEAASALGGDDIDDLDLVFGPTTAERHRASCRGRRAREG